jgi:hypothetical protein
MLGIAPLIERGEALDRDVKGAEVIRMPRRHGGDQAGIQPAAQQRADGDIADETKPDGIIQRLLELPHDCLRIRG